MKNYTIGILNPADFTNEDKYGGALGYLKSILPSMGSYKIKIFGLGINGTRPWVPIKLSRNHTFIPIADFKFPSIIPMRIKSLYAYFVGRNKILSSNIDILYIHFPEICLPYLKNSLKIPVVYHQHGFSNPLHSSKYSYGKLEIFKRFYEFARILIYRYADWIIQIDPIGVHQSHKFGGAEKTTLLMNAVNTNVFKPNFEIRKKIRNSYKIKDDIIVIFNAGRIEKQKGLHRLIKAIPIMDKLDLNYHIFIAGDGTHKKYLEDLSKNIGNGKVTFLGRVPHSELKNYYNMADIFVLPSEREGVPMAILESLACGTPVIANDVGGISGFLIDGKNGKILKNLSHDTIATTIKDLIFMNLDRKNVSASIINLSSNNAVIILDNLFRKLLFSKKD